MEDVAALGSRVFRKCGILAMTKGEKYTRTRAFSQKVKKSTGQKVGDYWMSMFQDAFPF